MHSWIFLIIPNTGLGSSKFKLSSVILRLSRMMAGQRSEIKEKNMLEYYRTNHRMKLEPPALSTGF
jgi:hypothetical protein